MVKERIAWGSVGIFSFLNAIINDFSLLYYINFDLWRPTSGCIILGLRKLNFYGVRITQTPQKIYIFFWCNIFSELRSSVDFKTLIIATFNFRGILISRGFLTIFGFRGTLIPWLSPNTIFRSILVSQFERNTIFYDILISW